jgi:hypothetical protein
MHAEGYRDAIGSACHNLATVTPQTLGKCTRAFAVSSVTFLVLELLPSCIYTDAMQRMQHWCLYATSIDHYNDKCMKANLDSDTLCQDDAAEAVGRLQPP